MKRGLTGEYLVQKYGEETVRAFMPFPLPPKPPLSISPVLQEEFDRAHISLGRLDSVATLLPDVGLFLYTYIRKEAVLSSQIEGTKSTLSDLLLFEMDGVPGVPIDDVVEVSNYVAAVQHGLQRIREGFPLSNRLVREIHGILLSKGRGSDKTPGEFRRSQNWIQGTRPGNARYVPPPPDRVAEALGNWEKFLNDMPERTPALIKAALMHVQFETIHPFSDGNGRIGRLMITLLLCHERILHDPLLYLSLYFKKNRERYFDLLMGVRAEGDWEEWLGFFAAGVGEMAEGAVATARGLNKIFEEDRSILQGLKRKAGSALQIHQLLQKHPLADVNSLSRTSKLSQPTIAAALDTLQNAGIIQEITGKKRNRLFVYKRYLDIMNKGTEIEEGQNSR